MQLWGYAMTRFTKEPGRLPVADDMILLGDVTPIDVTLPADLGGDIIPVKRAYIGKCPVHVDHDVNCLELVNGIHVAECDQFYWFRRSDANAS